MQDKYIKEEKMKGTGNSGIFETSYYDGSYLLF